MLSLTPEENSNSGIVTYQEDNDKCLNGLEFAVSCFSKKRVTRNFELNQNFEVLYNIFTKYCTCRVTRVVVSIVTRVVVSIVTRVVVSIVTRVVVSIAAFSFYSKLSNCSWQSLIDKSKEIKREFLFTFIRILNEWVTYLRLCKRHGRKSGWEFKK